MGQNLRSSAFIMPFWSRLLSSISLLVGLFEFLDEFDILVDFLQTHLPGVTSDISDQPWAN
jgi:hypothetical protein